MNHPPEMIEAVAWLYLAPDGSPIHREAADALERLRKYAMHLDGCPENMRWTYPDAPCNCGLDALIAELEGER